MSLPPAAAPHAAADAARRAPPAGKIAICIATYRRPRLLRDLLVAIDRLATPRGWELEVRIVDNDAARSATAPTVEFRHSNRRRLATIYAVEPTRNIALARNRAVDAGPCELVAFIDDDERPEPDWLTRLFDTRAQHDADAVFGSVAASYAGAVPDWIAQGRYFDKPIGPFGVPLDWKAARTCNALVAGEWFYDRGLRFNPRFGRSGGEDSELFRRMAFAGASFYAAPGARVAETVHRDQARLAWLLRRHWRGGVNLERVCAGKPETHPLARCCGRVAVGLSAVVAGLPLWCVGRRERLTRGLLTLARAGGGLYGWLRPHALENGEGYRSAGCVPPAGRGPAR